MRGCPCLCRLVGDPLHSLCAIFILYAGVASHVFPLHPIGCSSVLLLFILTILFGGVGLMGSSILPMLVFVVARVYVVVFLGLGVVWIGWVLLLGLAVYVGPDCGCTD